MARINKVIGETTLPFVLQSPCGKGRGGRGANTAGGGACAVVGPEVGDGAEPLSAVGGVARRHHQASLAAGRPLAADVAIERARWLVCGRVCWSGVARLSELFELFIIEWAD